MKMLTMNKRSVGLLCLLLLLLGTVAAHAKIVFGSERDGEVGKHSGGVPGIYVMDDDGSNLTLLIEDERFKPYPYCWSPDGKQILFERGSSPLYLMNADGTNIQRLIENDKDTRILSASFSPDGKSIVFGRDFIVNNKERNTITVMDIATKEMEVIAEVDATNCDWSPDGRQIVFDKPSAIGGGGNTIWIMDADGHNPRPLLPPLPQQQFFTNRLKPRWSPDGQQIAFLQREYIYKRWPGLGNALIYLAHRYMICDRNGENIKQLKIPEDYDAASLDWMDDGESIVFTGRAGMPLDEPIPRDFVSPPSYVYKYHLWTRKITQLTDDPGWDTIIDWISDDVLSVSPQGKKKWCGEHSSGRLGKSKPH